MFHGSIHVMSWENWVKQSFLHHFTFLNGKSKLSFFSLFSMRVDKTTSESQAESVELLLVSGRFLKKFIYKLGHRFINLVFKTRFLVESNFLIYYPPNWIFDYLGVIPNSNMVEENFCWTVGILISIFPALKNFQVKWIKWLLNANVLKFCLPLSGVAMISGMTKNTCTYENALIRFVRQL